MFTRVCGVDVSLRDVTMAQMGNRATECGWRHAPEAHGGFGGFCKSQLFEFEFRIERRRLAFACSPKPGQWPFGGCHTCCGGSIWKSHHRKIVHLSPYVEEPSNSKVIKSFVPELISSKSFSYFKIPMFYVYMLWTVYVRFTYPYLAIVQSHQPDINPRLSRHTFQVALTDGTKTHAQDHTNRLMQRKTRLECCYIVI